VEHRAGSMELAEPVRWNNGPVLCGPVEHRAGAVKADETARWNIGPVRWGRERPDAGATTMRRTGWRVDGAADNLRT